MLANQSSKFFVIYDIGAGPTPPPVTSSKYIDREGNFYVDRNGNNYIARPSENT